MIDYSEEIGSGKYLVVMVALFIGRYTFARFKED
jgi:hypothetical protein